VSWERPFDQPIPLPSGPPARTLRDAANYIRKLSASERDTPELRLAIQMLIDAAEDRGPMLFAKMGIDRALTRNRWGEKAKRRNDCVVPRIRWTSEENERLLGLIAAGKSWTFISAALRRDTNSAKLHAGTLRRGAMNAERQP
jgi:hypothetical protein